MADRVAYHSSEIAMARVRPLQSSLTRPIDTSVQVKDNDLSLNSYFLDLRIKKVLQSLITSP